jgi:hypothetical protein
MRKSALIPIAAGLALVLWPAKATATDISLSYLGSWLPQHTYSDSQSGLIAANVSSMMTHGVALRGTFTRTDRLNVFLGAEAAFSFAGDSAAVTSAQVDVAGITSGNRTGFHTGSDGEPNAGIELMFSPRFFLGINVPVGPLGQWWSVAAGSGLSFDELFVAAANNNQADSGLGAFTFGFPLWAEMRIKPTCGFSILAFTEYDVTVVGMDSYPSVGAGLAYDADWQLGDAECTKKKREQDARAREAEEHEQAERKAASEREEAERKRAEAARQEAEEAEFAKEAEVWRALESKPPLSPPGNRERVLAEAAFQEKDADGALRHFQNALLTDPLWPDGNFDVAPLYAEQKNWVSAVRYMRRYLALVPDGPDSTAAREKLIVWEDKAEHPPPLVPAPAVTTAGPAVGGPPVAPDAGAPP